MSHESFDLTETEQPILDDLAAHMVATRPQRAAKIGNCIEALRQADEVTRLVARTCVEHYISESSPGEYLAEPSFLYRDWVIDMAPGMLMAARGLNSKLMLTGEFVSTREFIGSAISLGFKVTDGLRTTEFLFQWLAAHYPDSQAAKTVEDYGLKSGRMSHDIYRRGDFQTEALLFHQSATQKYIDAVDAGSDEPRSVIDPIIYLAVTDDWETATSFLTPSQLKRLR